MVERIARHAATVSLDDDDDDPFGLMPKKPKTNTSSSRSPRGGKARTIVSKASNETYIVIDGIKTQKVVVPVNIAEMEEMKRREEVHREQMSRGGEVIERHHRSAHRSRSSSQKAQNKL